MVKLFQYINYIDYNELINKPLINKVVVEGDKSLADYGIQPAGNYAHLNENGKVPLEELDDSLLGNLQFQTLWDAENNNPQLPLVPTQKGQYWIVSNGGERFGLTFNTGDWLVAGDGVWQKVDNSDAVTSVNGKIGNVILTSNDISHNNETVASAIESKQDKLTAGKNITIKNDVISAEFNTAIIDYNLTYNKPSINGVELINAKTLEDFDIQRTIKAGENVYLTQSEANKMSDTVNVYDASETRKGVSEIATQEEVNTGTDDFRYVTPKKLKIVTNEINTTIQNNYETLDTKIDDEISRAKNKETEINNDLTTHKNSTNNPHNVTKEQVGLGNVNNTSDLDKPISTAVQTALNLKANNSDLATVAKSGSYNDLIDKPTIPTKTSDLDNDSGFLTNIPEEYVTKTELSTDLAKKADVTSIPTKTSDLDNDSGFIDSTGLSSYVLKTELATELESKQDTLTFDNVPTLNSNNPVTSSGIKTSLDLKQDLLTGNNGEVLYHNGQSVLSQSILNEGMIVLNTSDLDKCKNNAPSFQEVFNSWKKFSHLNGVDNAKPTEMSAWTYSEEDNTVVQPLNTESYCGFVSPKSYSNYDITVRLYSTGSDDDVIGMVAAFATDSDGKEHTLSFLRTPWNNTGIYKWVCKVDHCTYDIGITTYNQYILVDKTNAITVPSDSSAGWNTTTIGSGTIVNMTRNGNIITGTCSQFNSSTLDSNTTITIDLDALSATYPILNIFKGASSWGYSTFSQPNSIYENISVTDPDGYIFDISNNQVLQYNSSSKTWEAISSVTPIDTIGAGRMSYNKVTGKLFYCTGNEVFQIATNTDI
nr:MAG TPA: putative virion structural protein [Caudoviricetes sp.]